MMRIHVVLRRLHPALPVLAGLACGGGDLVLPTDGQLAQIEMVEGDDQIGSVGRPLPLRVVIRLVDQADEGIPGQTVSWVVSGGGGSVAPSSSTTDDEGRASAEWTLGPSAGANTLEARVSGADAVTFSATGNAVDEESRADADRSTVTADPTVIPAETGSSTITVTVRDSEGEPVEGATVALQATGAENVLTQPSGATGAEGTATGTVRAGAPGSVVVSATIDGSVQVRQTAAVIVTPSSAARIELIEGGNQMAPVGNPVPISPAVQVEDAEGQPVAGVAVEFVVTAGGGNVQGPVQLTNADGIARVGGWTLGPGAGINTLEARAGSLQGSPVVFTAEGTLGTDVDRLVFRVGPRDVDTEDTFPVEVALVDAAGSVVPLTGIEIYIGLFKDGSDVPNNNPLVGDRFQETVNGVAVFSLRISSEGRYRLRALTDDLPAYGIGGPRPYLFSELFEVD